MPKLSFLLIMSAALAAIPVASSADKWLARSAFDAGEYGIAAENYEELDDQGSPEAAFVLAIMHLKGRGFPESVPAAEEYMRKAADRGYLEAQAYFCNKAYQAASSREGYEKVLEACWAVANSKDIPNLDDPRLSLDRLYVPRARYRVGVAYGALGEGWYEWICFASAYIYLNGKDSAADEVGKMREVAKTLGINAQFKISPVGHLPDIFEIVEPCQYDRAGAGRMSIQMAAQGIMCGRDMTSKGCN